MTYNAGSRLVTSVEGAVVSTYTFDANGNQTAVNAGGSRTTYAYDYENRMRTAIDPGGARSTMAYWADGTRRFLEVGGTRTTFVWDGSDYLQSRTPSEVTTFSTVDAQILDSETGGSESLLVPDPLGSVVKVLDASGNQVYDAAYWPYGEIRDTVGVNDTSWGYVGTQGYHFDSSRRLYVRARVLDPVMGRWYTVDPLWPTEQAFEYANSAPTILTDPSGLACTPKTCKDDGSPVGGCIALFCGIEASFSYLKNFTGLGKEWDGLLRDLAKQLKKRGKVLDPDECCKTASTGGFPGSKKDAISILIGIICRAGKTKGPNPNTCSKMHEDVVECRSCCGVAFEPGTALYGKCFNKCGL